VNHVSKTACGSCKRVALTQAAVSDDAIMYTGSMLQPGTDGGEFHMVTGEGHSAHQLERVNGPEMCCFSKSELSMTA